MSKAATRRQESSNTARFAGFETILSNLIQWPTISWFGTEHSDDTAVAGFREELRKSFPLVQSRLLFHDLGPMALLFEWPGRSEDQAVLLAAHFDVFPPGEGSWSHPPFSGAIHEGHVWGRGAQDTKITLAAALSAAEKLLGEGFTPQHTIFFGFGGDEELGGTQGASSIASYLEKREIRLSFVLDEGSVIVAGGFLMTHKTIAFIGTSEKGYVDITLESRHPLDGGRLPKPWTILPQRSAAFRLARSLMRIERRRFHARLCATTRAMLQALSPHCPAISGFLLRNADLAWPVLKTLLGRHEKTDALIRTTMEVTGLEGGSRRQHGSKDGAQVNLNIRILPGESVFSVLSRISRIVEPLGIRAFIRHEGQVNDPLPESPLDHPGYKAICAAVARVYPDAVSVPCLVTAGTDTKHYRNIADALYRFSPLVQSDTDLARIHGTDEHISVENARNCAAFYYALTTKL